MKSKANVVALKTDKTHSAKSNGLDWLKWLVTIVLLLAGMVGNHYYSEISMPIRVIGWLAIFVAAGFVAATTTKGKWVTAFFRDSRMEMRKVVWPTREETTQTTLVVVAMVIILALILWGLDGILVWLIGWLTGQHG